MVWPAACCISHTALLYLEVFSPPPFVSEDLDAVLSLLVGHTTATQSVLFRSVKTAAAFIDCGGEKEKEKTPEN